jgi:SNF2 family DNA or RNA helicase
LTFDELNYFLQGNETYLNQFQVIGIDEVHNLYKGNTTIFNKIIKSTIKYRWGITGTPFVSDTSLFHIIKFLCGHKFNNERIANSPIIQDQFMKLFLKNCKTDMIEYEWPELNVHDILVKLDITQQRLYDTEKMTNHNSTNLRRLVCDINLMFDGSDFKTPAELKQYGIRHYKESYDNEVNKLQELKNQLKNIHENKLSFTDIEFVRRIDHFNYLIKKQIDTVSTHKKAYDYFMSGINAIMNEEDNNDDNHCIVCYRDYDNSIIITYSKICGHYFCKDCCTMIKNNDHYNCPVCRQLVNLSDTINVCELSEITNSSKIHELLKIIPDNSENIIIFTQFDKVIDKIETFLSRNNITFASLDRYTNEKVLLLSSNHNAEGINLSIFDKMIIFEPFENNMYSDQVEKQLIARIHRIGRTKSVDIYRFITEGTIEEDIYRQFQ